jgi:hypothetical protein
MQKIRQGLKADHLGNLGLLVRKSRIVSQQFSFGVHLNLLKNDKTCLILYSQQVKIDAIFRFLVNVK